MAEYIDRVAFKKSVEECYCKPCKAEGKDHNGCWCRACWVDDMLNEVECFQTSDVAPVVRCKDCMHWDDDPDTYGTDCGPKGKCMKSFETMCADDFCSHGERKDSDNAT